MDFQALRDRNKKTNLSHLPYGSFLSHFNFPTEHCPVWMHMALYGFFEGVWILSGASLRDGGSPTLRVLVSDLQVLYTSPELDAYNAELKDPEHPEQETNKNSKIMDTKLWRI